MFSQKFDYFSIKKLLDQQAPALNISEIQSILESSLSLEGAAKLIASFDNSFAREIILKKAVQVRQEKWRGKLFLIPPLYISNGDEKKGGCLDSCSYCPWDHNKSFKEKLKRLSAFETEKETKFLIEKGYRDIELVSATDSAFLNAKNVFDYIVATKKAGAKNVGINFFPLKSVDDYHELAKAGCTFSIVWQETYCPSTYKKMHSKGPKSDMQYRLDAQDRALQGGIKTAGVAFLGGLNDWKLEALSTLTHALYLRDEYGANIIFGMPRLKSNTFSDYSDEAYCFVGAIYSLAIPEALPWFSTREVFELSARASEGGGCVFTLDSSTEVGGYTRNSGYSQFPVYSKSFSEGVEWLNGLGFDVNNELPW